MAWKTTTPNTGPQPRYNPKQVGKFTGKTVAFWKPLESHKPKGRTGDTNSKFLIAGALPILQLLSKLQAVSILNIYIFAVTSD